MKTEETLELLLAYVTEMQNQLTEIQKLLNNRHPNPRQGQSERSAYKTHKEGYAIRGYSEAAIFLGIPTNEFKQICYKGAFRHYKAGANWVFNSVELKADYETYLHTL